MQIIVWKNEKSYIEDIFTCYDYHSHARVSLGLYCHSGYSEYSQNLNHCPQIPWGLSEKMRNVKKNSIVLESKGWEKNKKAVMIQTRIFQEACSSLASVLFSNLCDGIFWPGLAGVRFWTWTWLGHGKTHFRWRRVRRLQRTCSSRYSGLTRQAS